MIIFCCLCLDMNVIFSEPFFRFRLKISEIKNQKSLKSGRVLNLNMFLVLGLSKIKVAFLLVVFLLRIGIGS